jgi:hypothetical protein
MSFKELLKAFKQAIKEKGKETTPGKKVGE